VEDTEDFVDERAIEDILESIENDRNVLDVSIIHLFVRSYNHNSDSGVSPGYNGSNRFVSGEPDKYYIDDQELASYNNSIASIDNIIQSQVEVSTHMASHLESLASHYDQMAGALRRAKRVRYLAKKICKVGVIAFGRLNGLLNYFLCCKT